MFRVRSCLPFYCNDCLYDVSFGCDSCIWACVCVCSFVSACVCLCVCVCVCLFVGVFVVSLFVSFACLRTVGFVLNAASDVHPRDEYVHKRWRPPWISQKRLQQQRAFFVLHERANCECACACMCACLNVLCSYPLMRFAFYVALMMSIVFVY